MKRFVYLSLFIILIFSLAACTPAPQTTSEPVEAAPTEAATPLPEPTATPEPTAVPMITIYYEENSQVEIVAPDGTHIYIDVIDLKVVSAEPTENDFLLTTHTHGDHLIKSIQENFPGKQLFHQTGELGNETVKIWGIASAHMNTTEITENASNYIYVIEIDGVRIAHFGDIGQEELSQEQLDSLGQIDVAFTQFENSFSAMSVYNKKGFNLMDQLNPKIIMTTHGGLDTATIAVEKWDAFYKDTNFIQISKDTVPDETTILFIGKLGPSYQKIFNLDQAPW